jgi:hypothetical protein
MDSPWQHRAKCWGETTNDNQEETTIIISHLLK